ncbi:hypothetical protein pb186bvf_005606 [Paramecium bursaria]
MNQALNIKQKFDIFVQSIKQWIMALVNEASIGLYQIQCHLKEVIILLRNQKQENVRFLKKTDILIQQQQTTIKEIKEINHLNKEWATNMQLLIDKL